MIQYSVIGKKAATFVDKKTGDIVSYGRLFVEYPDEETEGLACDVFPMNPEVFEGVEVGDLVEIACNKKGKAEKVYVCA